MGRIVLPSGHLQGNHERLRRTPLYELEGAPRFVQGFSCRGLRSCGLCRRFTSVLVPEVSREGSDLVYTGPVSSATQRRDAISPVSSATQWRDAIFPVSSATQWRDAISQKAKPSAPPQ